MHACRPSPVSLKLFTAVVAAMLVLPPASAFSESNHHRSKDHRDRGHARIHSKSSHHDAHRKRSINHFRRGVHSRHDRHHDGGHHATRRGVSFRFHSDGLRLGLHQRSGTHTRHRSIERHTPHHAKGHHGFHKTRHHLFRDRHRPHHSIPYRIRKRLYRPDGVRIVTRHSRHAGSHARHFRHDDVTIVRRHTFRRFGDHDEQRQHHKRYDSPVGDHRDDTIDRDGIHRWSSEHHKDAKQHDAWHHLAEGHAHEGLAAFARLANDSPKDAAPKVGYALSLAAMEQDDTAVYAMRRAFRIDPHGVRYVPVADRLSHKIGKLARRYHHHAKAHRSEDAWFMTAALHYLRHEHEQARSALHHIDPDDASASTRNLRRLVSK